MTHEEIYIPAAFILGGLFEIAFSAFRRGCRIRKDSQWNTIMAKLTTQQGELSFKKAVFSDILI